MGWGWESQYTGKGESNHETFWRTVGIRFSLDVSTIRALRVSLLLDGEYNRDQHLERGWNLYLWNWVRVFRLDSFEVFSRLNLISNATTYLNNGSRKLATQRMGESTGTGLLWKLHFR